MLPWARPTRQLAMGSHLNSAQYGAFSERDPLRATACRIIQL
jgi:hypothetical protein